MERKIDQGNTAERRMVTLTLGQLIIAVIVIVTAISSSWVSVMTGQTEMEVRITALEKGADIARMNDENFRKEQREDHRDILNELKIINAAVKDTP